MNTAPVRSISHAFAAAMASVVVALTLLVAPGIAHAQDNVAKAAVEDALKQIKGKDYDGALELLAFALDSCTSDACTPEVEVDVYFVQAVAYGMKDEDDKAREAFVNALKKKATAKPNARFMTRKLTKLFSEAQAVVNPPPPPPPKPEPPPPPPPNPEPPPPPPPPPPKPEPPASTKKEPTPKASQDTVAKASVEDALQQLKGKEYDAALESLDFAIENCRSATCSPDVLVDVYFVQAVAHGMKGDDDKARESFVRALKKKPEAQPNPRFMNRRLTQLFGEAQASLKPQPPKAEPPPPPKPEPPPPPAPPKKDPPTKPVPAKPVKVAKATKQARLTASQQSAISEAKAALDAKDWEVCLATMVQSLADGDYAAGKLMAARCQDRGELLIEAKRDADAAAALAASDGDDDLSKEARSFAEQLDGDIPRIGLKFQSGVTDLVVKIDNTRIPNDRIREPIAHNPGTALVEVTGKRGGEPYEFTKKVTFQRSESIDVDVVSNETPLQACYRKARNATERKACDDKYNPAAKGLNLKAGLEISTYNDNNLVDVLSPAIYIAAVQPTQGWNIGGQAIVDVVSTASADIVAMASRRFDQVRVGSSLGGGYKVGVATIGANVAASVENDYVARTLGANVSADLFDKMVSPYVTYDYSFDILGRSRTSFDVFRRDLERHNVNFGASVIFNPTTVGVFGGTVEFDRGDSSKPYRLIPMFDQSVAPAIPSGASPALVAAGRLPMMPFEQLPLSRDRFAVLVGAMHRFDTATLRGTQRVYFDDWGQVASTTDIRYLWDFFERKGSGSGPGYPQLRLTPHVRFHTQGPVNFWQRAYVGSQNLTGYVVPKYRTGDRELGPLWSVTTGLGLRSAFNRVVSVSVQADGIYTQFQDHLYLFDRWGLFTVTNLELEFD